MRHPQSQLTYEMVQDILKDLSMTQISQICARYHDDKFGTSSVSPAVLKEIRRNVHDKTYLLDEVPTAVPLDNPSDALTLVARPDLSAPVELPPTCQLDQGLFGFLSERLPAPSG